MAAVQASVPQWPSLQRWSPLPGESWLAKPLRSLGMADVFGSAEDFVLPSKRLRDWTESNAKRRRTGSWHCPPLLSAPIPADQGGRSLFAKPKPSSASRLSGSAGGLAAPGSALSAVEEESSEEDAKSDGSNEGAQDAIEVKDAETLWKVNIEAVYRRKNPPGSPRDPAVLPGVEAGGRKLLEKVPEFIAKYKEKGTPLSHLYAKVCRTYDLDPKVMWATRGDEAEPENEDEDGACFKENAFDEGEAKATESSKPTGAAGAASASATLASLFEAVGGSSGGAASSGGSIFGASIFDTKEKESTQKADSGGLFLFGAESPAVAGQQPQVLQSLTSLKVLEQAFLMLLKALGVPPPVSSEQAQTVVVFSEPQAQAVEAAASSEQHPAQVEAAPTFLEMHQARTLAALASLELHREIRVAIFLVLAVRLAPSVDLLQEAGMFG
ncbi:unnamed protein product [Durusdinium trenchii]|uniref:Uncharacterized protein n=1 Tax=Durusdinium trenchii TaxID=1381693 RepID=A0ABP0MR94_9DINO